MLDSLINYYYVYHYHHLGYVVNIQRTSQQNSKNKTRIVTSADPREYCANVSSQMQIN